jgi:hypothetical protein
MDFIERWFGVSPDGGNGSLEITVIILAIVVLTVPFLSFKFRLWHHPEKRMNIEPAGCDRN